MANVIKHKRGSGSDPVASDLVVGEVAIRTDVGKLFTKMDNGSVAEIAGGGSDIAINTLSSSSATGGGSATFNGSAYRFTLSAPPSVSAQQLLVSINGVIQKPVAGTGQPSEGFSVDGTDIILGDAPATGSDFFILTFKSLGVSEPADNSVTSAKIVDGAIVNADINASAAIASTKIADFVTGNINNRVLTATGTTNSLNGEAALVFDGTRLGVGGTPSGIALDITKNTQAGLRITDTAVTNASYEIRSQTGNNTKLFRIIDVSASADRLVIDSSGKVGIGTTSPSELLQVAGTLECNNIKFLTANKFETSANVLEGKGTNGARLRSALSGATTPSFSNSDDIDTGMFLPGSDVVGFTTGGSEKVRITSDGNVGISVTNPQAKLNIQDTSNNGAISQLLKLGNDSSGSGTGAGIQLGTGFGNAGSSVLLSGFYDGTGTSFTVSTCNTFGGAQSEKFRITNDGKCGINTSSPSAKFECVGNATIKDDSGLTIEATSTSTNGQLTIIGVNSNNQVSAISRIKSVSTDGSSGGAAMTFSTRNTSNSMVERARFDQSGNFGIGVTNPNHSIHCVDSSDVAKFDHTGTGNTIGIVMRHARGGLSGFNGKMISFIGNDSSEEGSINIHQTSVAYNTSSDYRLKENEVAITDGVSRLKTLKPYKFNFKKSPDVKVDGFFAHEVSSVVPEAITGTKDEVDSDNNPVYQGIDHSKLVPLLVAALQEAIGRIEVLEAK